MQVRLVNPGRLWTGLAGAGLMALTTTPGYGQVLSQDRIRKDLTALCQSDQVQSIQPARSADGWQLPPLVPPPPADKKAAARQPDAAAGTPELAPRTNAVAPAANPLFNKAKLKLVSYGQADQQASSVAGSQRQSPGLASKPTQAGSNSWWARADAVGREDPATLSAPAPAAGVFAANGAAASPLLRDGGDPHEDCWSGFYVGVQLGLGMDSSNATDTWRWLTNFPAGTLLGVAGGPLVMTTAPSTASTTFRNQYEQSSKGLLGGVEAGYNWQDGIFVFGIEGDFSGSTQNKTANFSAQPVPAVFPPLPNFFFVPVTTQGWSSQEEIEWMTTLRGRVGVTAGSSLWYATGGLAVGEVETSYGLFSTPGFAGLPAAAGPFGPGTFAQFGLPGGAASAHFHTVKVGWVVGAGVETKILQRLGWGPGWTLKLEYLFADLGTVDHSFGTTLVPVAGTTTRPPFLVTGSTSFASSLHVCDHMIRVGLNYKF